MCVSPMHSPLHRTRWRTRARTASPGPASSATCQPTGATRWCCGAPAPPGSSWTSPTVSSHCSVDVAAVASRSARHRLCCRSFLRVPHTGATYAVTCGHMPHVCFFVAALHRAQMLRTCSCPTWAAGRLGLWCRAVHAVHSICCTPACPMPRAPAGWQAQMVCKPSASSCLPRCLPPRPPPTDPVRPGLGAAHEHQRSRQRL